MSEKVIATGLEFPEGPACDRNGNLYVVEIRGGRVQKITPDGTVSLFARPGGGPKAASINKLYNLGLLQWSHNRPKPACERCMR